MKTLAALLLSSSGCFVLTGTTTTTKQIGVENGEGVPGAIDHVTLAAAVAEHTLTVRAVASRSCIRDVANVYEVRESQHLRMGGPDDPRAKVFGLLLAPVTLPVSAVISGFAVMGSDRVTRATKIDHREKYACTTPAAQISVAIELPSGTHDTAVTNAGGEVEYSIPLAEPYSGTIVVKNGDVTREVAYQQPVPALVDARESMAACGASAATLALAIDATGHITHTWVAGDTADLGGCVRRRLARVVFPFHDETIELPFGPEHVVDTARRVRPVCAAIDAERDQLPEADRDRAQRTLAHVLEQANLLVVDGTCEETFRVWHERAATGFVVHMRGQRAARHTQVPSAADVPAAYGQLAAALVELDEKARVEVHAEPAPAVVGDLGGSDVAPAAEPPVARPLSFEYLRFGTGSVTGIGGGIRYRPGALGVDASAFVGGGNNATAGGARVQMLLATRPEQETTWYFGAGLSLGGTSWSSPNGYMSTHGSGGGVAFEGSFGYEFTLASARSFFQADLSAPMYAVRDDSGNNMNVPNQLVVSWGIGGRVF